MFRITHIRNLINWHFYSNLKGCFESFFFFGCAYSHNLVRVYMKCDYTHLNRNLLVSQKKKSNHQGCDYKGGLLYFAIAAPSHYLSMESSTLIGWFLIQVTIKKSQPSKCQLLTNLPSLQSYNICYSNL
jgi:hypothetical protein